MEVDARLLGRPPRFTGIETDSSMADHLDAVETNSERVIPLSTLGDVAVENAWKMFYSLTMLLQRPPLLLLKRVERGFGLEAWRQLVERYKGANASL